MIQIRKATASDIDDIYELVRELAIYQDSEKHFTAAKEEYLKSMQNGHFECILAIEEEEVRGMAVYYTVFSTWKGPILYLEDFVVKPEYRSQGIGVQLLDKLVEIAKKRKFRMLKWQVIHWNEKAIKLYKRYGATVDSDTYDCKLYISD